ncbi:MAG TPA: hypothetical protein VFC17_07535 [Candidatus Limnocylindrales bacterium]|nr:hypothetical protein [Candidatus Limnocylindrales bacterium]
MHLKPILSLRVLGNSKNDFNRGAATSISREPAKESKGLRRATILRPERRGQKARRGVVEVSRGVDAIDFKWYQNKRNAAQNPPVDLRFGKGGVCADSRRQGVAPQIPASTISRLGDFERPGWR